jgi:hypothetical protein
MRDERFEVRVSFDERRGYVASAPELRAPVVALSLGGLRRRVEVLILPDEVRCCPMRSASCCSSTVSPSANATAAGRRRPRLIRVRTKTRVEVEPAF